MGLVINPDTQEGLVPAGQQRRETFTDQVRDLAARCKAVVTHAGSEAAQATAVAAIRAVEAYLDLDPQALAKCNDVIAAVAAPGWRPEHIGADHPAWHAALRLVWAVAEFNANDAEHADEDARRHLARCRDYLSRVGP